MVTSTSTVDETYAAVTTTRDGLVSRWLAPEGHPRIHALERRGQGPPAVLLHSGGSNALSWIPLLDELDGRHVVAVDRPGFGRSEQVPYEPDSYRATAVRFVEAVADGLEAPRVDLVGNSMGGTWALWAALDRPERLRRLVLVGAPPLTPGTTIPGPLRLMAAPLIGELLSRLMTPSPATVERMMGSFGEGGTVGDHPEVVAGAVAGASDPDAAAANLAETRAVLSALRGFRDRLALSASELATIQTETQLVWGAEDPVGGADVGRELAATLPSATLEVLPAGHVPWFGHPTRVAELLEGFLARPM